MKFTGHGAIKLRHIFNVFIFTIRDPKTLVWQVTVAIHVLRDKIKNNSCFKFLDFKYPFLTSIHNFATSQHLSCLHILLHFIAQCTKRAYVSLREFYKHFMMSQEGKANKCKPKLHTNPPGNGQCLFILFPQL